jgi:hypothetical protein
MTEKWIDEPCSKQRGMRYSYKILIRKPESKRPLQRPKCYCEDNIKIDFNGIVYDSVKRLFLS